MKNFLGLKWSEFNHKIISCKKEKFWTPPQAPIKNFKKFRKIELSNPFSHQNQKSFKTLFLYIKIHHLSREENIFQIMLTLVSSQ